MFYNSNFSDSITSVTITDHYFYGVKRLFSVSYICARRMKKGQSNYTCYIIHHCYLNLDIYMYTLLVFLYFVGLKEFNSSKIPDMPLAVFNGQRFVVHLGFSSLLNKLKLLFNYGLSLFRMSRSVHSELKDFSKIYKLQERGECYRTVPDMLRAMGGDKFCHEITVS